MKIKPSAAAGTVLIAGCIAMFGGCSDLYGDQVTDIGSSLSETADPAPQVASLELPVLSDSTLPADTKHEIITDQPVSSSDTVRSEPTSAPETETSLSDSETDSSAETAPKADKWVCIGDNTYYYSEDADEDIVKSLSIINLMGIIESCSPDSFGENYTSDFAPVGTSVYRSGKDTVVLTCIDGAAFICTAVDDSAEAAEIPEGIIDPTESISTDTDAVQIAQAEDDEEPAESEAPDGEAEAEQTEPQTDAENDLTDLTENAEDRG